jgi:hypothetical protein
MFSQAPSLLSEYADSTLHYFTFSLKKVVLLLFKNTLNNHFLPNLISYSSAHPGKHHSSPHCAQPKALEYCFVITF